MTDANAQDGQAASEVVLLRKEGALAFLTLNRPEKLNALNEAVRQRLMALLAQIATDPEVKVAILHGAGERAFAAGADVSEFASRTPHQQREVYRRRRVYDALGDFPKPILAAVHGHCLGGGSELALACDLRIADSSARFGQAEIRLGLIPGAGGTQRLARLVGPGQAARLAFTGDTIDAHEAHRIGLVEILADPGMHLEKAREVAERMARWSGDALQLAKRAVKASQETSLSVGLELEKELFLAAFASPGGRKGVANFLASREK
ncbi:MAG: enoyl-CoA hydratase/isomerase family protein [Gemmatimonadota bacterium]